MIKHAYNLSKSRLVFFYLFYDNKTIPSDATRDIHKLKLIVTVLFYMLSILFIYILHIIKFKGIVMARKYIISINESGWLASWLIYMKKNSTKLCRAIFGPSFGQRPKFSLDTPRNALVVGRRYLFFSPWRNATGNHFCPSQKFIFLVALLSFWNFNILGLW